MGKSSTYETVRDIAGALDTVPLSALDISKMTGRDKQTVEAYLKQLENFIHVHSVTLNGRTHYYIGRSNQ